MERAPPSVGPIPIGAPTLLDTFQWMSFNKSFSIYENLRKKKINYFLAIFCCLIK